MVLLRWQVVNFRWILIDNQHFIELIVYHMMLLMYFQWWLIVLLNLRILLLQVLVFIKIKKVINLIHILVEINSLMILFILQLLVKMVLEINSMETDQMYLILPPIQSKTFKIPLLHQKELLLQQLVLKIIRNLLILLIKRCSLHNYQQKLHPELQPPTSEVKLETLLNLVQFMLLLLFKVLIIPILYHY